MKKRTSFVSNSSSTSFIIINKGKPNEEETICILKNITLEDLKSFHTKIENLEDFIKYFFSYSADEKFYEHIMPEDRNLCEGEALFIEIKKEEDEKKKNMLVNKFFKICKEENEGIYKLLLKIRRTFNKGHEVVVLDDVEYNSLDIKLLNLSRNKDIEIIRMETVFE